jgi:hypothetical protein
MKDKVTPLNASGRQVFNYFSVLIDMIKRVSQDNIVRAGVFDLV